MRTLATDGLTLEPQTVAHAGPMFAVLGDPAIYAFENAPPPSLDWLAARFAKLETRRSADGREQWLKWVVRLPTAQLAGYVQATVRADGSAAIAYEFASAHWGRGIASRAVLAMIDELVAAYGVTTLYAIAKRANLRSHRLLERLSFARVDDAARRSLRRVDADEVLMERAVARPARRDGTAPASADAPLPRDGIPPGARR
jgi:RimJ/RimL family protein N-acetyltransferase